ncbi:MAG: hypothetical protein HGB35_06215 [Geobacteraceae bacterium]|nr:hypothetical protein [Geobacteraceae bacterium]
MRKISGSNVYFKKILPFIWFGFLGFFIVTTVESGAAGKSIIFSIMPIFMGLFGFFLFKWLVWDLVDEVYDTGDELLFRKGGTEQRVKLRDIVNIDSSRMNSPERITINVRNEGPLGKELVFNPPMRFFTYIRNPLVTELIERVDRARNT